MGDRTDGVPGAAHALQTRGHRWRGFHLHHQLHRAHVDAQLQRARGHHRLERAFFEHGFRQRALILGHRTVVRAGNNCRGLTGDIDLFHQLGRVAPGRWTQGFRIVLLGIELIEPAGEPLGGAARVNEDEGGALLHDFGVELFFNEGPDGLRRGQGGISYPALHAQCVLGALGDAQGVVDSSLPDGRALLRGRQVRHVFDRHVDVELPALLRGRGNDVHGTVAAQEVRDSTQRAHRRRQSNALKLPGDKPEALQSQRQVHAALGAGQGVDLIDNDGIHGLQNPRRLGGEHQVGRFRRGDEDVRWLAYLAGALGLQGIPGAHADGNIRHLQAQPVGGAGNAVEWGAQIVLYVHTQSLEW